MQKLPLFECARVERKREVQRQHDRRRGNSSQRGYGSQWRKAREQFLIEHPTCECGAPATEIDHNPPHKGDMVRFWDMTTWFPTCKPCHQRKSVLFDGTLGRPIRNYERDCDRQDGFGPDAPMVQRATGDAA